MVGPAAVHPKPCNNMHFGRVRAVLKFLGSCGLALHSSFEDIGPTRQNWEAQDGTDRESQSVIDFLGAGIDAHLVHMR
eukprot:4071678-Karenia_brevis.AAC.1